jgi:hypothetical protein
MKLWGIWWSLASSLRPAFARTRTFLWFTAALAALCIRSDLAGVSSIIRSLGLQDACYDRLLDMFHSRSVDLDRLTRLWASIVLRILDPFLLRVGGRVVLLADGIKVAKSGKKMPGVKKLHQESESNSKPEYIFGHSCQAIAVAVKAGVSTFALPLACRIHEGVVFSNRDRRTLLDKMVLLAFSLGIDCPSIMVADAYYTSAKVIKPLLKEGNHLVSAVRSNAVAYLPAEPSKTKKKGKGRPRFYGEKVKLKTLFDDDTAFVNAPSPVYGEKGVALRYRTVDLLWRPVGVLVRFVLVVHPTRGRKILLCTDTSLSALEIIGLYGVRFKIEVSFKQAIHTVGTYAYHFWMMDMKSRPRRSGNQYMHRESRSYRDAVRRKLRAYHCHIQLGVIAQGILHCLAVLQPRTVWNTFGSWLRTIRPGVPPSERVVACALRNAFPEFLADSAKDQILAKFIRPRIDMDRAEGLRLAS